MKGLRMMLAILMATCAVSCRGVSTDRGRTEGAIEHRLPPGLVTVTWTNYRRGGDLADVEYIVNGKLVGRGDAGLAAILAKLETLNERSTVYVYPDPIVVPPNASSPCRSVLVAADRRDVPLHLVLNYERCVLYLAALRGFSVQYLADKPGTFVRDDGMDARYDLETILSVYFNIETNVGPRSVRR